MLPLVAPSVPSTAPELTEALIRGLADHRLTARHIEAESEAFPSLARLRIDLSGARVTREIRPPQTTETGGVAVEIAQFEVLAAPIYFEEAALEFRLVAELVKSRLQMADGRGNLVLESAGKGTVSAEIAHEALEALVHRFAVAAAAKQGFEVRKTSLNFTQEGPRAVAFRAEVTAKIFVMSATLALTGRLRIDDEFNARFSDLSLDGDGMILKLASGYARPYLDRLEGRVFPLLAFTAGGLQLRDVALTAGPVLKAHAVFGAPGSPVT